MSGTALHIMLGTALHIMLGTALHIMLCSTQHIMLGTAEHIMIGFALHIMIGKALHNTYLQLCQVSKASSNVEWLVIEFRKSGILRMSEKHTEEQDVTNCQIQTTK